MKDYISVKYNHWNFVFGIVPTYWKGGVMTFHFGIFKLFERPPEGEQITNKHYTGFWIQKVFRGFGISF